MKDALKAVSRTTFDNVNNYEWPVGLDGSDPVF